MKWGEKSVSLSPPALESFSLDRRKERDLWWSLTSATEHALTRFLSKGSSWMDRKEEQEKLSSLTHILVTIHHEVMWGGALDFPRIWRNVEHGQHGELVTNVASARKDPECYLRASAPSSLPSVYSLPSQHNILKSKLVMSFFCLLF